MCTIDLKIKRINKYECQEELLTTRAHTPEQAALKLLKQLRKKHYKWVSHRIAIRQVKIMKKGIKHSDWIYFKSWENNDGIRVYECNLKWEEDEYNWYSEKHLSEICLRIGFSESDVDSYFAKHFLSDIADDDEYFPPEFKMLFVIDRHIDSVKLYEEILNSDESLRKFLGMDGNPNFWVRVCPLTRKYTIGGINNHHDDCYEFDIEGGITEILVREHDYEIRLANKLAESKKIINDKISEVVNLRTKLGDVKKQSKAIKRTTKKAIGEINNLKQMLAVERDRADKMETSFMAAEQEITELRAKLIELTLTSTTAE